jgi:salicylate biosynthesis isochorismate synthase
VRTPTEFAELCAAARAKASGGDGPVLVSWSSPLPSLGEPAWNRMLSTAADVDRVHIWASSWSGSRMLSLGSVMDLCAEGAGRFSELSCAWRRTVRRALVRGGGPRLVGGFAFAPFCGDGLPDALMWLPAVQVTWTPRKDPVLRLNAVITRATDPLVAAADTMDFAGQVISAAGSMAPAWPGRILRYVPSCVDWQALVAAAVREIGRGTFAKVVLARKAVVSVDPQAVPCALRTFLGSPVVGAVFGIRVSGRWFLGATPECLVRVTGKRVATHGLAGSAPRGTGPVEDAQFAARLMADSKIDREHRIVADSVRDALAAVCTDVRVVCDEPVLRLPGIQHRQTIIRAIRRPSTGLLDLAALLHPTPAVGGYPGPRALDWLAAHEPFERGWYAAPVGWMGGDGEGELAVAIRSAMVTDHRAYIYAGCGIVAGSDPLEEYRESVLKMRPMLAALGVPAEVPVAV